MSHRSHALAASLACIVALVPNAAHACSCALPGGEIEVVPGEDTFAPRNTWIWVAIGSLVAPNTGVEAQLLDSADAVVETDRSEIMGGSAARAMLIVLTARESLLPNAGYTIEVSAGNGGPLLRRTPFRTNDAIDVDAPAVPEVLAADVRPAGTMPKLPCSGEEALTLTLTADAWVLKRDPGAIAAADPFDAEHATGSLEDFVANDGGGDATLFFGGACTFEPWQGFPASMQFATLDLAGNFSGWGETKRFSVADQSCAVSEPGSEPPFRAPQLSALAIAVVLVRRMRRRR